MVELIKNRSGFKFVNHHTTSGFLLVRYNLSFRSFHYTLIDLDSVNFVCRGCVIFIISDFIQRKLFVKPCQEVHFGAYVVVKTYWAG